MLSRRRLVLPTILWSQDTAVGISAAATCYGGVYGKKDDVRTVLQVPVVLVLELQELLDAEYREVGEAGP